MQLEMCALFAWPALIRLVQVCTACFKCRCLFECIHGKGKLAIATLQLACLVWGSVILSKISEAACVMHPEDNVNPYVLLKVLVVLPWVLIGAVVACLCFPLCCSCLFPVLVAPGASDWQSESVRLFSHVLF